MIHNSSFQCIKKLVLFSGFLFIVMSGFAQREYDLLGKSARAAGMAYAFSAVADDATAITWNPGGLVSIKKPEMAFTTSLNFTRYRHEVMEYDYRPSYNIDYLGIVYPLKIKKRDLVFGVSFQNRIDYKYSYNNLPSKNGRDNGKKNLTVNSVSVCWAYSVNRFIGIGLTYNRWFSLGNDAKDSSLFYTKILYQDNTYADEKLFYFTEQYKYSGNNITAGIIADFTSLHFPLKAAVRYDSRFALKDEFSYNKQWSNIRYDQEDTTWSDVGNGTRSWDFPAILTAGLSYRYGNYLTLAVDFDIKLYNNNLEKWNYRYEFIRKTEGHDTVLVNNQYNLKTTFQYKKSVFDQFRIGAEYVLHPSFALIPLRVGWKTNPSSLNTYNKDTVAVKRVMAHSANLGTGLVLKHLALDLAYEAYWYQRVDEDIWNEKKVLHGLILSVIWYIQ